VAPILLIFTDVYAFLPKKVMNFPAGGAYAPYAPCMSTALVHYKKCFWYLVFTTTLFN